MITYDVGSNRLYCFKWDFIDSNMYMIIKNNRALVIDPVCTVEVDEFTLKSGLRDITVLLTHEHFDHINGINLLRENFKTTLYCIRQCAERICNPKTNLSDKSDVIIMFNSKLQDKKLRIDPFACAADIVFDDNIQFEWEEIKIYAVSTPGHSKGSVCIFCDDKFVFSGDTLLEYPVITRLPGGSKKDFYEKTIPFLKNFIGHKLIVFPGHGQCFEFDNFFNKKV